MNEFIELRSRAREKRDKAIKEAYAAYEASLTRIAELEQDLLGRDPVNTKSIAACIDSVLPTDRTFTTVDVMAALEALDPTRPWRKRSLDNRIAQLRRAGVVRRLKKSQNRNPAVYVRVGVSVESLPFEDKTLPEVIAEVLGDRCLNRTELAVAMIEAGYQTTMKPRALSHAVGVELRQYQQRFRQVGDKWRLC